MNLLERVLTIILFALAAIVLSIPFTRAASAQSCTSTACVNVGDTLVFTWTAPKSGPTPQGYNLVLGSSLGALSSNAAANIAGANFYSVGNVLTYSLVATAAMIGTLFAAVNDYVCPTGQPTCNISALSPTVTFTVSQLGAQPPSSLAVK